MRPILALLSLVLACPALASDGVMEINQTCAVGTGCFAGDTAGFPVTIDGTAGHSHRLTSDLTLPNENVDGIVVSSSDVTIDLAGFAILGPVICSGEPPGVPLTCTPSSGTGSGVKSSSRGVSVKNGSIAGMGAFGVALGDQAEVTNLRVRSNRLSGIVTTPGSIVSGNTAYQNGQAGIFAFSSTVSGNTIYQNGGAGIQADGSISGNTVYQNGGVGINAFLSTVSGNTVYRNKSDGIIASGVLSDNAVFLNGGIGISSGFSTISNNSVYSNGGSGIFATNGSSVRGNTVRQNTGFGLELFLQVTYRDNTITNNTAGTVTGLDLVNKGDNYCAGTGTSSADCP